jgi:hypothetical protein
MTSSQKWHERGVWVRLAGVCAMILAIATSLVGFAAANENGISLRGEALKDAVSGKRIYLSVPLGGELPLYYRADGRVDGSGEAAGLGRFLKPSDSGRWWVEGERLCQQWESWYQGRVFCFTVRKLPENKIAWARDDGEKGIARIGR